MPRVPYSIGATRELEQGSTTEMAARKASAADELEAAPFLEPEEAKLHKGGMGWKRAAFTMMAEIVGTGVLGLSHAAAKVGGGLALVFLVGFGLASLFSSLLLAAVRREHPKVDSFQACAELLGGRRAEFWTALCINTSWLFVLPYYLMASAHALSVAFWWTDTCYATWALLSVLLIGVPAQVRTFEGISSLSALSVMSVALALVIIGLELVRGGQKNADGPAIWAKPPSSSVWDCFDAVSSTTFAYQGQSMLLEIGSEMADKQDFGKAITASCAGLLGLYTAATALGYYYRGARVAGFLPDDLEDNVSKTCVGLLLYFHVAVTYLVNNQPLSKKLYELRWGSLEQKGRVVSLRWFGITSLLLVWSYVLANAIPWFSAFQALLGSLLGAPIMFGFPVAFYVLDARQAASLRHIPTRAALYTTGGLVLPLTLCVGTVAAFVGLWDAWGDGAAFSCVPEGYAG